MSTGGQRSGTTPLGSWTGTTPVGEAGRGKKQTGKDLPLIMLMHGVPYVATACPSYPEDYLAKLEKAKQVKEGLVYIHILTLNQTFRRRTRGTKIFVEFQYIHMKCSSVYTQVPG